MFPGRTSLWANRCHSLSWQLHSALRAPLHFMAYNTKDRPHMVPLAICGDNRRAPPRSAVTTAARRRAICDAVKNKQCSGSSCIFVGLASMQRSQRLTQDFEAWPQFLRQSEWDAIQECPTAAAEVIYGIACVHVCCHRLCVFACVAVVTACVAVVTACVARWSPPCVAVVTACD